jgi:putative transposase
MDNVFAERLWKSVKYEEVYLKAYESVAEARPGIGALRFYNYKLHQGRGYPLQSRYSRSKGTGPLI